MGPVNVPRVLRVAVVPVSGTEKFGLSAAKSTFEIG
jgi:hypothetical protein